ncbi:uncharacterized protein LOC106936067, partial [Poecilia latipinna]|uniref:uncharacterized protein LOC106936067 n=1 Tax=Poecilia latipinna TaxID=48699 RepID=UPI00072EBDC0
LFHCVSEVEMCVRNTGKVDFDFNVTYFPNAKENKGVDKGDGVLIKADDDDRDAQHLKGKGQQHERLKIRPGWPVIIPSVGYISAGSEKHLRVLYLPGIPEVFKKQFQLQVAFLPPQEVTLTGVGVFPRIRLNLPRNLCMFTPALRRSQALPKELFHCVSEVEMCVRNTGKVDFDFNVTYFPNAKENKGVDKGDGVLIKADDDDRDAQHLKGKGQQHERLKIRPGWPVIIPSVGHISAGSEKHLRVLYLPGIPEVFKKQFQLQVAFLPPQEVTLTGVGVFPRIRLNLPRNLC